MICLHPQLMQGNFTKTWINLSEVNCEKMETVVAVEVGYFELDLEGTAVA